MTLLTDSRSWILQIHTHYTLFCCNLNKYNYIPLTRTRFRVGNNQYSVNTMDKLTTVSATLFMAADVFAIVSLAMPDWIVTDVGGKAFNLHLMYQGHLLILFADP